MAAMGHDAINRVAETVNHAEHSVRDAATTTAEAAKHAQDQVGAAAEENLRKLRSYIERNPLASAGVAFAAGVLLSAVVRR
jgi:ElaB/YqjD/DUF883 family membrane-anchored ribosome-binding protein